MVGVINSMDMGLKTLWEMVKDREAWRAAVLGFPKSRTQLSDSTTTTREKNLKKKMYIYAHN